MHEGEKDEDFTKLKSQMNSTKLNLRGKGKMKGSFEQNREHPYIRNTSNMLDRKYSRERDGLVGKSLENLGRNDDPF